MKSKIRKGDEVIVLAGKDRGKTGKIIKVFTENQRVLVQGVNFAKKHHKRKSQQETGGILDKENSLHISNVSLLAPGTKKSTRVGVNILKDGSKTRVARRNKEVIE